MKKMFFAFLLLMGSANMTNAFQGETVWPRIVLQAEYKKPVTNGIPVPKSPVTIPDVFLADHTLYIDSIGDDAIVQLVDDTDTVVYSIFVPDGTTTVILPSTLTGDYELDIIPDGGDYYYCGEITL